MNLVNIHIRYSDRNAVLDEFATFTREDQLVFNDREGHVRTAVKFALLSVASPLFALARLVRSVVFFFSGDAARAGSEFLGSLATPFIAVGCLIGTLSSALVSVITPSQMAFYVNMRRTYANFEAWINQIDLKSEALPTYSRRVSNALDWVGTPEHNHIWTTAPCMQPVLEHGLSDQGGIFDAERIQKLFPFVKVNGIEWEGDQIVIQSEYENNHVHYEACNGIFQHTKASQNCCCCYRIEAVYDRVLCCEVGRGNCSSIENSGDSCGIVTCCMCGAIGACCCYEKEDGKLTQLNAGCFGPEGIYIANFQRVRNA